MQALALCNLEANLTLGTLQKHELAIRNAASMNQLLHNIKYSAEIPFAFIGENEGSASQRVDPESSASKVS